MPTLSRLRPRVKPGVSRSTTSRLSPRCRLAGSVRTAVITRSALIPLVMNVFAPLTTYSSPSTRAEVAIPARSEPAPGSVIAIAVISSPDAIRGNQRSCCCAEAWCRK